MAWDLCGRVIAPAATCGQVDTADVTGRFSRKNSLSNLMIARSGEFMEIKDILFK